eukprot:2286842-Ditylum_brightwellii.AAC.1
MHPNPKNQREEGSIEKDHDTAATRKENSDAVSSLANNEGCAVLPSSKRGTRAIHKRSKKSMTLQNANKK